MPFGYFPVVPSIHGGLYADDSANLPSRNTSLYTAAGKPRVFLIFHKDCLFQLFHSEKWAIPTISKFLPLTRMGSVVNNVCLNFSGLWSSSHGSPSTSLTMFCLLWYLLLVDIFSANVVHAAPGCESFVANGGTYDTPNAGQQFRRVTTLTY